MKTLTLPSGKSVNVPSTGEDWQLYTYSMKCGNAARALTAALVKALRIIDQHAAKGYAPTSRGAEKLMGDMIYPVMNKYAEFGACDTEPRNVAYGSMERAIEKMTGHRVYL